MVKHVKALAHHRFQQNKELISKYCKLNMNIDPDLKSINEDSKWNQELYYEYKSKLMYCQISKISSTTWINHLAK